MSTTENKVDNLVLNTAKENNFTFFINKFPELSLHVTEVGVPGANIGTSFMSTPGVPVKRPGTNITYNPLVMIFKVDENYTNWIKLYNWMIYAKSYKLMTDVERVAFRNSMKDIGTRKERHDYFSDCSLLISTNNKNYNFTIILEDVFPIEIGDLPLKNVAPEEIESNVTFEFMQMKIKD
jgi:hypothetical protein